MKQFFALIRKEFYHIMRDYRTLLVLLGMPVAQILLFGFALSTEVKNTRIAVLNHSQEMMAMQLLQEIDASQYFNIHTVIKNHQEVEPMLSSGLVKMVLIIPTQFGTDLSHTNESQIQLITDASDPNVATTIVNYASAIIQDFQENILLQPKLPHSIKVSTRMLYNPQLKGEYNFVPGVIALVLMLICTMMTSVSIVREKEFGNMEILLVSPMKPLLVILSKAVPYLLLGLIILSITLFLSVALLHIPIQGNLILLYGVSLIFIITALSLGLLISSITENQQNAMMVSLIGLMLPTIMLSGFIFPIENMPMVLQVISNIVPAKWYFFTIKSIMIKGLGIVAIWRETLILLGFAIFFLGFSLAKFKIRLA